MEILRKPPKYTKCLIDKNGKARCYYRRPNYPSTALPGLPWSPKFMAAYEEAEKAGRHLIGEKTTMEKSVSALAAEFYKSGDYTLLKPSTKKTYRGIIERFRSEHGDKSVIKLQSKHLRTIISSKSDTPAAANNMIRVLRLLLKKAVDIGWREDNPARDLDNLRYKKEGFKTWDEEHISQFEKFHPPGSRARIALEILLYIGQRRSDFVKLGPKDIDDGMLCLKQQKTGQLVYIPLTPRFQEIIFQEIIKDMPADAPSFITTSKGEPFTPAGFTNWFRDMCRDAGLPKGLSPHGVRKATCRRLAEAGCTPHQIMAISGHKSLSEVTRYTAAANRKDLAFQAITTLAEH